MFVGRARELGWLEEQYASGRYEMSIVYGRRRVGKTTLIREFIKDKRAIYFLATEASEETNLRLLSRGIHAVLNPGMGLAPFMSFEDAFAYVAQQAKEQRLIFVIDEYPYLAASVQGLSSLLQRAIDLHFRQGQAFIILSGSSMSFMEQQVLGQKSPLYGRRTAQYRVDPFDFSQTMLYLRGMSPQDAAVCYGVTGGVAEYLSFLDPALPIRDNLIRLFFESRGRLYEEPRNLLSQELRDPRLYNDLLYAIAGGAARHGEIAAAVRKPSSDISPYLKTLQELRIVARESSVGKQGSSKALYRIDDMMYRFWFRFVRLGQSEIELGRGDAYYDAVVAPMLSDYMGRVFEALVQEFMRLPQISATLPERLREQGRWWGTDAQARREVEIDYVGLGESLKVLGEAKWRAEKTGPAVLADLKERGRLLSGNKLYCLFSKSGFTPQLSEQAKGDDSLRLYRFDDMAAAFARAADDL